MPRSIYCSTCKKEKELGRENESRCFKCKSDAYKANRLKKRLEKGLLPLGSGRSIYCSDCKQIKENPKQGYCYECKNKRERHRTLKSGIIKAHRTGLCLCGKAFSQPGYCKPCNNAKSAKWKREHPEYYKQYGLQRKAYATVLRAIQKGMRRLPCEVCGINENVEAHHDDYGRPLDVRWLCRKHHQEHHKNEGK